MVSVTKNNTPALRFDGFDGEWATNQVGRIAARAIGGGTPSRAVPDYWNGSIPWIQSSDVKEHTVFGCTPKHFISSRGLASSATSLVNGGSIAVVTRVGVGKVAVMAEDYCSSQDFLNLSDVQGDLTFLGVLLKHELEGISSQTQGTSIKGVTKENVMSLNIHVPTSEEQSAIGELFADLDALIEQHRAKHANLQQTKTALMQRMYPQDGADEPELRLGGFSGAWELQPFSDLVVYRGHNSLSRADLTDVPTSAMNIHYGDILVKYGSVVDASITDLPFVRDVERLSNISRQSLSNGDVLFADAAEDSTVGKCVEVQGISDKLVLAGLHTISARPIRTFAPGFLGHALNAPSFHNQLLSKMQGTKVSSISISTLAETVFSFPTLEEQRAIGEVFSNLDALIADESRYIAQLTQAKAALLQRMFV